LEQNDNVEFILINDGSNDGTLAEIQFFLSEYPISNISLFDIKNAGLSEARNFGISKAMGNYIWFLDGDDVLRFGSINELLEIIDNNVGIDLIAFQGYDFEDRFLGRNMENYCSNNDWLIESFNRGINEIQYNNSQKYIIDKIKKNDYLSNACFYIVKSNILRAGKISFLKKTVYEDVLFTVKLLLMNFSLLVVPNRLILHRRRIGSITRSKLSRNHLNSIYTVVNELNKLHVEYPQNSELLYLVDFYLQWALRRTRDNEFSIIKYFFKYPSLIIKRILTSSEVKKEFVKNIKSSLKIKLVWKS